MTIAFRILSTLLKAIAPLTRAKDLLSSDAGVFFRGIYNSPFIFPFLKILSNLSTLHLYNYSQCAYHSG